MLRNLNPQEEALIDLMHAMHKPPKDFDKVEVSNGTLCVHNPSKCEGEHCCIHNPSDHVMKDFPLLWRADRELMERTCPHGVGHPDPDSLAYIERTRGAEAAQVESVHGCDGCCDPRIAEELGISADLEHGRD